MSQALLWKHQNTEKIAQNTNPELFNGHGFQFGLFGWVASTLCAGSNFMALLTVSTELALAEAGNSVLMASIFHGLATNFGFCPCLLIVTRHSTFTRLAQKFGM